MKILHVTDLHGDNLKYDKTFQLAQHYGVDVVVNSGDLLPKNQKDLYSSQKFYIEHVLPLQLIKYENSGIEYIAIPGNDDVKALDNRLNILFNKYLRCNIIRNCLISVGSGFFVLN